MRVDTGLVYCFNIKHWNSNFSTNFTQCSWFWRHPIWVSNSINSFLAYFRIFGKFHAAISFL